MREHSVYRLSLHLIV